MEKEKKNRNIKYVFDESTLSYKPIILTTKQKAYKLLKWSVSSFVFGVVIFLFVISNFDSPKEKILRRELDFLTYNYEILADKIEVSNKIISQIHERDNKIYRVLLEADPIPDAIMEGGFGGINRYEKLEGYRTSTILKDLYKKTDILTNKIYLQSKSLDQISELAKDKEKMLTHIPAIQPVDDGLSRFVSGFGYRYHPILKQKMMHYGVDFAAPKGTVVYATGDAKVKLTDFSGGFGKYIVLDHGFGYETLYGHLSEILVSKGEKIKRGQIIGKIGNTGRSSGPHLHYEIHKNKERINPINFYQDLTPEQYMLIVRKSQEIGQTLD